MVFNRPHFELGVLELTDDCLDVVSSTYSAHIKGTRPPYTQEAPAVTEYAGRKYLFTSGTTGFHPNRTTVHVFDDYHGNFECLGDPCVDDEDGTTFNSQISCIVCVNNQYIAVADRWIPDFYGRENAEKIFNEHCDGFLNYTPDLTELKEYPLPKPELNMPTQIRDSRYVFLPIEFINGVPKIVWHSEFEI